MAPLAALVIATLFVSIQSLEVHRDSNEGEVVVGEYRQSLPYYVYNKGLEKKKVIRKLKDDYEVVKNKGKVDEAFLRKLANAIEKERESQRIREGNLYSHGAISDDYWKWKLHQAEERVNRGLLIAARERSQDSSPYTASFPYRGAGISPYRVSRISFEHSFPIGNRAPHRIHSRKKRDLNDVGSSSVDASSNAISESDNQRGKTEENEVEQITERPAQEQEVSTTKAYQLCSSDGLSCSRTTKGPKVQEEIVQNVTTHNVESAAQNATSEEPMEMVTTEFPLTTEADVTSTISPTELPTTTGIMDFDSGMAETTVLPMSESLSSSSSLGQENDATPIFELRAIEENGSSMPMLNETGSSEMSVKNESSTNFDIDSISITTDMPAQATESEDIVLKMEEEEKRIPVVDSAAKDEPKKKDDPSTMDRVANWFESAWESVKSWF